MLFNIYYMNFSKVYEIKMMISNIIKTEESIETNEQDQENSKLQAKMGVKFLKVFNSEIGGEVGGTSSDSQKVLENFKVTLTKSVVLNEVLERCKKISNFDDLQEGDLIQIDNIKLSLVNEKELRTVKMFSNGIFKGLQVPGAAGLDINNLFNSMLKDYAYKLKGEDGVNRILVKIPITFKNEFENLYSVDDLFIGKVTIVGIYKSITKIADIKNTFEFFQELGENTTDVSETEQEIHDSQFKTERKVNMREVQDKSEYHYIDLLAIIQNVNPAEVGSE